MRTNWRCWYSGGVAAVMAAASQAEPGAGMRYTRCASAYTLDETLRRLEHQARCQGMPVLATVSEPRRPGAAQDSRARLLVLGSDDDHTPVLQRTADASLTLPLTVRVTSGAGGAIEVQFTDAASLAVHDAPSGDWPAGLIDRVAGLPALVDAALQLH